MLERHDFIVWKKGKIHEGVSGGYAEGSLDNAKKEAYMLLVIYGSDKVVIYNTAGEQEAVVEATK